MLDHVVVKEGSTLLAVPPEHSRGGPGTKGASLFFNAQMAFNRDVSVMLMRASAGIRTVADCMAATGSRSARMANEVAGTEVVANDIDPRAIHFIERNMELNSLDNMRPSNDDLACLLAQRSFDLIDLDPFGSPAPFLHAAARSAGRDTVLAITATDTAPLAGARRDKCERRYLARPLKWPGHHESGLRILMGTIARDLARFDKGMEPLLSFYCDHYFRVFVRVKKGAQKADSALANLGFMSYSPSTLERSVSFDSDGHPHGPMWLGPLHDRSLLGRMDAGDDLAETRRCRRMLDLWRGELDTPLCYEVAELSSFTKLSPPPMEVLLECLAEHGPASRSHVSPTMFRTAMPLETVLEAYRSAASIDKL